MAPAGGPAHAHAAYNVLTIAASNTYDAGATTPKRLQVPENGFVFVLDITADEETVLDTLDVTVQTMLDGANWTDVAHFAQHLGNQGAERRLTKILTGGGMLEFDQTTALVAGQVRHAWGDQWRIWVAITDNSTNASFTFSVVAIPQ